MVNEWLKAMCRGEGVATADGGAREVCQQGSLRAHNDAADRPDGRSDRVADFCFGKCKFKSLRERRRQVISITHAGGLAGTSERSADCMAMLLFALLGSCLIALALYSTGLWLPALRLRPCAAYYAQGDCRGAERPRHRNGAGWAMVRAVGREHP